jgi:DNA-binding NarL/FixJ family response regulator
VIRVRVLAASPVLRADIAAMLASAADVVLVDDGHADVMLVELPSSASADQVLAAVRAAAAGLVVVPAALAHNLTTPAPPQPRPAADFIEPLSPRESEILGMLAEGLGNKTIAARLNISRNTVKAHVSAIFAKLGASTRAEAVAIGARSGLIVL